MFPVVPAAAEPLVRAIAVAFTRPTARRFVTLMCAIIVTLGRRTVSHSLLPIRDRLAGHWSDYHRLFSHARIEMWRLAAALVRQVIKLLPDDVVIALVADDTVISRGGDRVWGKSAHRDSSRATRGRCAITFGHRWLVLCVLVQLPGCDRPWALPLLCGMCLSPKAADKIGDPRIRQKTPSQLTRQLLCQLMRWLPDRRFILCGDYQVVTHQTVAFAQRHAARVTVVGRLRGDANVYAPPGNPQRRSRTGQLPKKGRKLPSPSERATQLTPEVSTVTWYGNQRREVRHVGETTLWYDKHASAVTPIRWVCVLGDAKQNLHDAFFFCSDPQAEPTWIIEHYARRWNIEVTFQESNALLGLATTRHWCRQSVLRVTPILLGLFSAVVLIWQQLPASRRRRCWSRTPCYTKRSLTFADALAAVRRELWERSLLSGVLSGVLRHRTPTRCLDRLPRRARQTILWHLAAAA